MLAGRERIVRERRNFPVRGAWNEQNVLLRTEQLYPEVPRAFAEHSDIAAARVDPFLHRIQLLAIRPVEVNAFPVVRIHDRPELRDDERVSDTTVCLESLKAEIEKCFHDIVFRPADFTQRNAAQWQSAFGDSSLHCG